MKTLLCFVTFLFVLLPDNRAQQEEPQKVRLVSHQCGAAKYIFEVDQATVGTLPVWHPESDRLAPVTLKKAIEIGRNAIKRRRPDVEELEITSTSLDEMVSGKRLGRWYYKLGFVGKRDAKSVYSCSFQAVILMDGSSVEPVETGAD